jgi:carbamoylphosphate synthase large subunit
MQREAKAAFSLSELSWKTWLPAFLHSPEFDAKASFPNSLREIEEEIEKEGPDSVIILSHHNTLLRDADWLTCLQETFGLPIYGPTTAVAELAWDKRAMAQLVNSVAGLQAIPEWSYAHAVSTLVSDPTAIAIVKKVSGTEGSGYRVAQTSADLEEFTSKGRATDSVIQPFLFGREYSVNVAGIVDQSGSRLSVFEAVDKGDTGVGSPHPSRRTRECPSSHLTPEVALVLRDASLRMSELVQLKGVAEFEFIVVGKDVFLLEVNPRVSATMRMASLACDCSLFTALGRAALSLFDGKVAKSAVRHSREFPLPEAANRLRNRGQIAPGTWITSRVTIAADTMTTLADRLSNAEQEIRHASRNY